MSDFFSSKEACMINSNLIQHYKYLYPDLTPNQRIRFMHLCENCFTGWREHPNYPDLPVYNISSKEMKKVIGSHSLKYTEILINTDYLKVHDKKYKFKDESGFGKVYCKAYTVPQYLELNFKPSLKPNEVYIYEDDKLMLIKEGEPYTIVINSKIPGNNSAQFVEVNYELGLKVWKYIAKLYIKGNYRTYNKIFNPKEPLKNIKGLYRGCVMLSRLLDNSNNIYVNKKSILVQYEEKSTGRLCVIGTANLQTTKREIRNLLLSNMNYYDYDFENCHYNIFEQTLKKYGADMSEYQTMINYNRNKKEFRKQLMEYCGISEDKVKSVFISLVCGDSGGYYSKTFRKILTKDEIAKINKYPSFKQLKAETMKGAKFLIEKMTGSDGILKNAIGKVFDKKSWKQRISFILQGFERQMLDVILEEYWESIILLMHDGFVSTKILDIPRIENIIEQKTGYKMKLEMKELIFDESLLNM